MRTIVSQLVISILFAGVTLAQDAQYFSVNTNEETRVRYLLMAYEKSGFGAFESTNESVLAEQCRELIGFYLLHTNSISLVDKLAVSRCLVEFGLYTNAENLALQYANVYSNDIRVWQILGASYDYMNLPSKAIEAYNKAVNLGDTDSYEPLAGIAIKSGNFDVLSRMIPKLMTVKNSKQTPAENRLHLISILLFYAAKTDDKTLFNKTLEGENLKDILQNDAVRQNVKSGCELFEGQDIEKLRTELEAATGSSLSPTTNAPPH